MKRWIIDRFLPMWAKETVLRQARDLDRENEKLRQENARLQAYIKGLERGAVRRIIINQKGEKP